MELRDAPTAAVPTAVMVPVDGSERSRRALPIADVFADAFRVPVVTVSVADSLGDATADVTLMGDPAEALLAHLAPRPDVMVCMSSHGRTGLTRRLVGSVADQLLRHSPVPVVVASPAVIEWVNPLRSILAGVAWPPSPDRVVALLAAWAPRLHATVELAHIRAPSAVELYARHLTGLSPADQPDIHRYAEMLAADHVDVTTTHLLAANPAAGLRHRAHQLPPSVLCAVDSHHGGHDPAHDVAYQLIADGPYPVLATVGHGAPGSETPEPLRKHIGVIHRVTGDVGWRGPRTASRAGDSRRPPRQVFLTMRGSCPILGT